MIDLPPLDFPKPAIIRPAPDELLRYGGDPMVAMLPGTVGAIGKGKAPLVGTYVTAAFSDSNLTTYSFSGINVGSGDKFVVVAASGRRVSTNRNITGVSIGGSAATIDVVVPSGTTATAAAIASRLVPGGGTISISFTLNAQADRGAIGVWTLNRVADVFSANWNANNSSGNASLAITLNHQAGGFAVFGCGIGNQGGITWSSATERATAAPSSASISFADLLIVTTASSVSQTASFSTTVGPGMAGAVYI